MEERLLAGHPTERMRKAQERVRWLNMCARGRWIPSGGDGAMPVWSPWVSGVEKALEQGVRQGVANALSKHVEAARAELAAAEEERRDLVRQIRRR